MDEKENNSQNTSQKEETSKCPKCEIEVSMESFQAHLKEHQMELCNICNQIFGKEVLAEHLRGCLPQKPKKELHKVVFCGIQESGKSSCLDVLLQKADFRIGNKKGKLTTSKISLREYTEVQFIDTVALESPKLDPKRRNTLCKKTAELFRSKSTLQLVFVVDFFTETVSPRDLAFISLVLQTFAQQEVYYGIILNRVREETKKKLENKNYMDHVLALINLDHFPSQFISFLPYSDNFNKKGDLMDENEAELAYWLSTVPLTAHDPQKVLPKVPFDGWKKLLRHYEERLEKIQKGEAKLLDKELEMQEELINQLAKRSPPKVCKKYRVTKRAFLSKPPATAEKKEQEPVDSNAQTEEQVPTNNELLQTIEQKSD